MTNNQILAPDWLLGIVRKRVHPALHHLVTTEALLADLRLNPVDHWSICCDIEEALGAELDWAKVEAWTSIPDILASIEALRCSPAPANHGATHA
jgi:hypothetical protein